MTTFFQIITVQTKVDPSSAPLGEHANKCEATATNVGPVCGRRFRNRQKG